MDKSDTGIQRFGRVSKTTGSHPGGSHHRIGGKTPPRIFIKVDLPAPFFSQTGTYFRHPAEKN
jgi:hypothetical protein